MKKRENHFFSVCFYRDLGRRIERRAIFSKHNEHEACESHHSDKTVGAAFSLAMPQLQHRHSKHLVAENSKPLRTYHPARCQVLESFYFVQCWASPSTRSGLP
uniref:Uncharacterized protein n=1 Tax=Opuntia streptacantha TaxID=393608 RepID=A0A7C9B4B9_OPUST